MPPFNRAALSGFDAAFLVLSGQKTKTATTLTRAATPRSLTPSHGELKSRRALNLVVSYFVKKFV